MHEEDSKPTFVLSVILLSIGACYWYISVAESHVSPQLRSNLKVCSTFEILYMCTKYSVYMYLLQEFEAKRRMYSDTPPHLGNEVFDVRQSGDTNNLVCTKKDSTCYITISNSLHSYNKYRIPSR